uniref:Uncharacterized protein n=1 Tax=Arundo donax TaxID=35708 RepID=A0A0A9GVG5_ARUDO
MLHAADSLLNVLACALLPALVDTPSDLPMLALLDRYAHRIKTLAATVGSTFHHHADILCDALILHAKRGRRRPLRVTAARLLEDTQDLRRRVIAFRSRDLHLSVVPVTAN